jgi:hypothetical protein
MKVLELAEAALVFGAGTQLSSNALHSLLGWSPKDVPVILPTLPMA